MPNIILRKWHATENFYKSDDSTSSLDTLITFYTWIYKKNPLMFSFIISIKIDELEHKFQIM